MDKPRFLQGQSSNDVGHRVVTNNFTPYNPGQGAFLPGPRITQLRIPNIERKDFGPDAATSAIVHDNIQAGQVAMQFGQHRQKHSPFSEESYSVRLLVLVQEVISTNTDSEYTLKLNNSCAHS